MLQIPNLYFKKTLLLLKAVLLLELRFLPPIPLLGGGIPLRNGINGIIRIVLKKYFFFFYFFMCAKLRTNMYLLLSRLSGAYLIIQI